KVSNDDHYNVFAIESAHPEQSKFVHDTYPIEQDAQYVIIDSLDMSNDKVEIDQNDDDNDLAKGCKTVPVSEGSSETKTVTYMENYKNVSQDIRDQLNAEAEHQNEVNEIRAERIAGTANPLALVAQQQPVYHPQNHPTHYSQNSSTRSQQAATRNRGKAIVNSLPSIYDQEPSMVDDDDEMSKDKEIDKLIDLISLSIGNVVGARETVGSTVVQKSGIQCYNCKEFGHVARECQKPKRVKDAAYHREKMILCKQEEAGIQLNAEQADWRDDTDDDKLEDQELEAHYIDDHYNVFAMESEHPEQSKSVHDTYPIEQDAHNAELARRNSVEYASKVEIDCAKLEEI
nr:hypothetical protein [Tanacetum cinerariifolium]